MKPTVKILVDGAAVGSLFEERFLSAVVKDRAGHNADSMSITLDDRGGELVLPRKGVELEILAGYEEEGVGSLGIFIVDDVSVHGAPDRMVILGKAANLRKGLRRPKERSWGVVSVGDLVGAIAAEHGLTASVSDELAGESLGHVDQTESDINLLTRLAGERGALAKVSGKHLLFIPKGRSKTSGGTRLPDFDLTRSDVASWSASFPDRKKFSAVTATWQNLDTGEQPEVTLGDGEAYRIRSIFPDEAAARLAAAAKLESLKRGSATFDFDTKGRASYFAELPIKAAGFRTAVDGDWVIDTVTHAINRDGYKCSCSCVGAA